MVWNWDTYNDATCSLCGINVSLCLFYNRVPACVNITQLKEKTSSIVPPEPVREMNHWNI